MKSVLNVLPEIPKKGDILSRKHIGLGVLRAGFRSQRCHSLAMRTSPYAPPFFKQECVISACLSQMVVRRTEGIHGATALCFLKRTPRCMKLLSGSKPPAIKETCELIKVISTVCFPFPSSGLWGQGWNTRRQMFFPVQNTCESIK